MAPRRYKRPESVLVLVCTSANEVLMLRRTEPDNFWQSVTGSLKWGESPLQAARRELKEETGLNPSGLMDCHHSEWFSIIPPWRARYAPTACYNREHWFLLRLPGRCLIRLNPQEHSNYRWLSEAMAYRLATSWTNRQAIRDFVG
ncbi:MAG: dihydroneopterin triphosphate diphosphatase [Gammaproteobacteria bacterium]|nr:dihydroneopterin triphosphate diphosphatase [Gammaproteobacteria bacterium]